MIRARTTQQHQLHLRTLIRSKTKSAYSLSTTTTSKNNSSSSSSFSFNKPPVASLSTRPSIHFQSELKSNYRFLDSIRSFHSSGCNLAETVKVPQMAESISEGTLKQWLKKTGDYVKADEEVATIETDKIDVSVNAPKSGKIVETMANEEDTVTVGQDLFKLEPGEGGAGEETDPSPTSSSSKEQHSSKEKEDGITSGAKDEKQAKETAQATPDRLPTPSKSASQDQSAQKHDRKRWSEVEVENKERQPRRSEPQLTESKLPQGRTDFDGKSTGQTESNKPALFDRTERRVKMNRMRSRISERLKQSQNTAASLTTFNEIDMSSLMEMRKLYKDGVLKERGVKLGFMSAFAKAACLALREIPGANASIEGPGTGDQIVYRDYVDLSVAVATPKGLVTPVVRNAESLGFVEIEEEIARLGAKAKDNKLSLEDMAGGTFTISNGGVFGSLYGTPIINLPQSAVLGMHTIKDTPVVRNGQIVIRPIMIVALTYDHRILDGREAVTFLVKIKEYIEDPRKMLLS
ncbi:2-oxoglutarate dehydrogenase complex E2 component [Puccinia graminis f. sp. tritici]|uniref:dihydrolipoyllysine-residue succinyltransferase n=1 Tax=Puccinia graminis f. sp. tritici TaxID=56615 RepID=A0A5B0NZE5_PUCGR|nr:2-oxoglutarate dehydrogenase complex E2 component [Puccinia graminis f. sp. tritici]KAA1094102.1 2-oxoglutarate dehydrogenase complex E2 component [Puccinia graminis f. sp. tritici]